MRDENGKLWGEEKPRISTPPLRELTPETSLGFSIIDFAFLILGITLLPWQKWLLKHAFEIVGDLDGEWHLRFRTVLVIVGRQCGKTFLAKVVVLWYLYILGVPLVVGMAQNLSMAEEVWEAVVDEIENNDEFKRELSKVRRGKGDKEVVLTGRRRYKVAPTTRSGGRGLTADLVLLDEIREHTTWEAWAAVTKTTLTRDNSLIWCISNAGDASSVVLRHLRLIAHKQLGDPDGICKQMESLDDIDPFEDADTASDSDEGFDSFGYFEWSAPPTASKYDHDAWAMAEPSLGYLIKESSLAAAVATDDDAKFRNECMCQWIEASFESAFPTDSWENGKDEDSTIAPDAEIFYGIDVSDDHRHIAIAACARRSDRDWHVEVIEYTSNINTALNLLRVRAANELKINVALQGKGANVGLIADSIAAIQGVNVVKCEGADLAAYHGRFYEGIAASETGSKSVVEKIRHRPQPIIDLAQLTAKTRALGDGAWAFNRKESPMDISALIACVMAFGVATDPNLAPKRVSAYADGHDLLFA